MHQDQGKYQLQKYYATNLKVLDIGPIQVHCGKCAKGLRAHVPHGWIDDLFSFCMSCSLLCGIYDIYNWVPQIGPWTLFRNVIIVIFLKQSMHEFLFEWWATQLYESRHEVNIFWIYSVQCTYFMDFVGDLWPLQIMNKLKCTFRSHDRINYAILFQKQWRKTIFKVKQGTSGLLDPILNVVLTKSDALHKPICLK